jgi:hypothetical protein
MLICILPAPSAVRDGLTATHAKRPVKPQHPLLDRQIRTPAAAAPDNHRRRLRSGIDVQGVEG